MEDVPSAGGLGESFAEEDDVIAPGDRIGGATESKGPKLRFCPESNDILYPREDKGRRVLVYACKSCAYEVRVHVHGTLRVQMLHKHVQPSAMLAGRCRSIEQGVRWLVCIQERGPSQQ